MNENERFISKSTGSCERDSEFMFFFTCMRSPETLYSGLFSHTFSERKLLFQATSSNNPLTQSSWIPSLLVQEVAFTLPNSVAVNPCMRQLRSDRLHLRAPAVFKPPCLRTCTVASGSDAASLKMFRQLLPKT